MTDSSPTGPLWTQDQAIAFEVAREAVLDVIAGYNAEVYEERQKPSPDTNRIAYLKMRVGQCFDVANALRVTDDTTVSEVTREYSAIVRARDTAPALAA